ncbi:MAG: DUF721 domain-containing protein [Nevskiaceae bacterium]|nr:MAG: DUF721 domain-containing protein [Nevskiaceae bacterium]
MSQDAEPLHRWLQQQPASIRGVMARAQRLAQINRALQQQWAAEPWIQAVRIANIRENVVVIYAQTASALIPLRYRKTALLAFLQQRFELTCNEIDAKVRPDY